MSASKVGEPGSLVIVHKLDPSGNELWRYRGVVLEVSETSVALEARYDRPDEDFYGLRLRRGDRYVETHYSDRWYNVFAIHDVATGELKAWYCNITRPAVLEDGHVTAVDLALDLLIFPDGRWRVLDEEEFNGLKLLELDRMRALETLEELKRMVDERLDVFSAIS